MKNLFLFLAIVGVIFLFGSFASPVPCLSAEGEIALPTPVFDGKMSLEKALVTRRTARSYKDESLTKAQVTQLLWAANGNLAFEGISAATKKVIPSARKTYPVEVFLVAGANKVQDLPAGVYHYNADKHSLEPLLKGDVRPALAKATTGHAWVKQVPVSVVVGAVFQRSEATSASKRGINFAVLEAGYANQNLLLQATALGFNTNTVGGLNDSEVSAALKLPAEVRPIVIVTVGK